MLERRETEVIWLRNFYPSVISALRDKLNQASWSFQQQKYRDRAAERREKYGIPEPPVSKKKFHQPPGPTA